MDKGNTVTDWKDILSQHMTMRKFSKPNVLEPDISLEIYNFSAVPAFTWQLKCAFISSQRP